MTLRLEDPLYRCCCILQRRRASRPDATHVRFVLDYQAWERAEPGTDRDKTARFSYPRHLVLENAYDWVHWDIPIRLMIQRLVERIPKVAASRATMPKLIEDSWLVDHEWIHTDYWSAEQHLQRYLKLIRHLGEANEGAALAFTDHLDPNDTEWVLLILRENRYWLVHLMQNLINRFMPPVYLLRNDGGAAPTAEE